jgi:putative DNA primase/helicase
MEIVDFRQEEFDKAVTPPILCAREPESDLGNARRLIILFGEDMLYVPEKGWSVWNGVKYENNHRAAMRKAKEVVDHILTEIPHLTNDAKKKSRSMHYIKSGHAQRIVAMLKLAESAKEVEANIDQFDANPDYLNAKNGKMIHLPTGECSDADKSLRFSRTTGCDYDPKAEAPIFSKFLEEVVPNEGMREYLQRSMGYSLTGLRDEQIYQVAYGGGANGKSVFFEACLAAAGEFGATTSSETFVAQKHSQSARPDIARLPGIRLLVTSEVGDMARLDETLVKDVTGGDKVIARDLYKGFFEFLPLFKLWFRGNYKPRIRGTDDGIWRRVRLIAFDVQIPYERRDKKLTQKIMEEELPGVLRWMVEGAIKYYQKGLTTPKEVLAATSGYRSEMDVVGRFIDDVCVLNQEAKVRPSDLYKTYNKWCHTNGEYALPERKFGEEIERRGHHRFRTSQSRWYKGIGLLDTKDDASDS